MFLPWSGIAGSYCNSYGNFHGKLLVFNYISLGSFTIMKGQYLNDCIIKNTFHQMLGIKKCFDKVHCNLTFWIIIYKFVSCQDKQHSLRWSHFQTIVNDPHFLMLKSTIPRLDAKITALWYDCWEEWVWIIGERCCCAQSDSCSLQMEAGGPGRNLEGIILLHFPLLAITLGIDSSACLF